MLRETYPELELILVNDRSTDATGAVADAFARTEPRLHVVHVDTLPERASGEWGLFSDADIHLEPDVLEQVVAYAEREQCDHVCVLPTVTCSGPVILATLASFFRLICVGARLWAVPDPRSSAAVGIGAFNLVRRSVLARDVLPDLCCPRGPAAGPEPVRQPDRFVQRAPGT
jgi:cellulose synthase/poly-beta-1,6-N-acetylglucosamine synthase-like glycosyltransferase